jgi:alpha-L-fucosidase
MIENHFFYTEKISAIVPVEIKIQVFDNLFETEFFNKDGRPIYVLEGREQISRRYRTTESYETFTDELYLELLSIDSEGQAEKFIIFIHITVCHSQLILEISTQLM